MGNVLIVDDERSILNGCRVVLAERGMGVDVCDKGRQGIEAALEGNYDVVLLDLMLPDVNGMEVLRRVREERGEINFIVITGYSTVQTAIQAMKLGAFDYLAKPFTDDELILTVERAIEKKKLVEENTALKRELADRFGFSNIIGENRKMIEVFQKIGKVAPTDCTVLIYGENGTGKELIARAIHVKSNRAAARFIGVDCCTLAPSLLESELFGHVKGAFTGALHEKQGIFELAQDGTLFLDDITNLNPDTQGKLLRVLEAHEYKPVGASIFKKTNARLISATNRDLQEMVKEGAFREDLYYRLNVFPVFLPPLRRRKDDIPRLAYHFLKHFCSRTGKRIEGFTEDALDALVKYDWPGNVRQLKNAVERLVIMADNPLLQAWDVAGDLRMNTSWKSRDIPKTRKELMAVKKQILESAFGQYEKLFLARALEESNGNITLAAERAGMKRSNFSSLIKKYNLHSKTDSRV